MAARILNVNNVKGSWMTLTVHDGTNTTQIPSASNHAQVSRFKLDEVHDCACSNVKLDGVIHFNQGVRVTDSTAIMSSKERDAFRSNLNTTDFAELVLLTQYQSYSKILYKLKLVYVLINYL